MAKKVLITGASSGLGEEFAKIFARDGYDEILVARSKEKLELLKAELESAFKVHVQILVQDLSEPHSARNVSNFVQKNVLGLDVLVNNAGLGDFALFAESAWMRQEKMIQLNVTTPLELTYELLPNLIQSRGKILNVASIASFMPGANMSVYYATKAFLRSWGEALFVELNEKGVSVTTLCPGPTKSKFWDSARANESLLMKSAHFATAKQVAEYGYKKMVSGSALAVPGFSNKMLVFLIRILPRSLVRNAVYAVQRKSSNP